MRHSLQHRDDDLVEMLQVIAAEVQLPQSSQSPPSSQEEHVVLTETSVLEVNVGQSVTDCIQHDTELIAHVTVAQVQSSKHWQSLDTSSSVVIQ